LIPGYGGGCPVLPSCHCVVAATEPTRWAEAKAFVERLLPVGTVSEKLEKYGRTLGRLLLRDGRAVSQEVLRAGLAKPYTGGPRIP
jgi:endonuclease YncB( thermonuclease family)